MPVMAVQLLRPKLWRSLCGFRRDIQRVWGGGCKREGTQSRLSHCCLSGGEKLSEGAKNRKDSENAAESCGIVLDLKFFMFVC